VTILLLLANVTRAQNSQFTFDPNGNLLVQAAAATAPPQIIGQPQTVIVTPGEATSFFVVAADTRALTYEWRFNGVPIGGSATNDALLLQNVSTNNEGEYRVVLTNPSLSVTSAPAMLWIDSDADGLPDSWELAWFGTLTNNATSDFDHDGVSNFQEFLDGTNPANSNSVLYHLTVTRDGGSVIASPDLPSYTNGQSVTLTALASPGGEPFHAWLGDIVTRSNPVTLVMTNNKTADARFSPIGFTWAGAASGDWNGATNWTPNLVPGSNDNVVIDTGATVTLNTSADCASVVLGGPNPLGGLGGNASPNLTGGGTLSVRQSLYWRSGNMSGSGRTVLETGAALILDMDNPAGLNLSTRTLELGGETFWTAAVDLFLNNAVITNRAGAVFHVVGSGSINFSSSFDNAGTFRKSGNTGTTKFASAANFNNYGTVEIETGTLHCDGSFSNNGAVNVSAGATHRLAGGGTSGGTFTAEATSLVEWTFGTFTLNGGAQLNGAGLYRINNPGNGFGTALIANTDIVVGNLDLTSGTLSGSGAITISHAMNWAGGTMSGGGRTLILPGATLNAAVLGSATLNARSLENGGTILWTGAGDIGVIGGAVLTNRAGALFEAQNAAGLGGVIPNGRLDNAGTFRKSVNTGTTTVNSGLSFNNYGTTDIRSGILSMQGGYFPAANALLNCALGGTNVGTGWGQLQVAGTVTLNGGLSVDFSNAFTPALNDSFTVLTAGTRSGSFLNFTYPANRVGMLLSNSTTSVVLLVTNIFPVPQPVLLTPQLLVSNALLTWTATSNVTYRLENNADVGSTNWTAIVGDVTTTSNTASKLDALTPSNRLYRVRVLP
jgi:hypothetical protein